MGLSTMKPRFTLRNVKYGLAARLPCARRDGVIVRQPGKTPLQLSVNVLGDDDDAIVVI